MSVGMSTSFSSWKETPSELREVAISIQSQWQGHKTSMSATDPGRLSLPLHWVTLYKLCQTHDCSYLVPCFHGIGMTISISERGDS